MNDLNPCASEPLSNAHGFRNESAGTLVARGLSAAPDRSALPGESRCIGFLPRSIAFFLDLLVVHLAYLYCFLAALAMMPPDWPGRIHLSLVPGLLLAALLIGAGFPVFAGAYFWLMHAWQGQTVGKMLLGIRVETVQGEEVGPGLAFVRCLGFGLALLPFGLGLFWCLLSREKRGWHDYLALTRVVAEWK